MKISNIYTRQIRIPLRTPFKTALRTVEHVHDVLVIIETDSGQAGFGEAPPTAVITGETIGSIEAALKECIAPALIGLDIEQMDTIMSRLDHCMVKNTSAKAAADMAVWDLFAKSCGKPLYQVLGGARKELETGLAAAHPKCVEKGFVIGLLSKR